MTMLDDTFRTVHDRQESFRSIRPEDSFNFSRRSSNDSSHGGSEKTTSYMNVSLGGVMGSLTLDKMWMVFSPNSISPARSWKWSAVKKHMVKEHTLLLKVVFYTDAFELEMGGPPGSGKDALHETQIFQLTNYEELKRLMKDISRRLRKHRGIVQPPTTRGSVLSGGRGVEAPPPLQPMPRQHSKQNMSHKPVELDPTEIISVESFHDETEVGMGDNSNKSGSNGGMDQSTKSVRFITNPNNKIGAGGGGLDESVHTSALTEEQSEKFLKFLDEYEPNDDKEEVEHALTDDIYSLIYTAPVKCLAFWFAVFTFICQFSILLQIFLDLVDISSDPPVMSNGVTNRLDIPPGVPPTVTVAQFIGVYMTTNFLLDGGDLIKGFDQLINGWRPDVQKIAKDATKIKWFVAGVLQSCSGLLMLTDLFVLSMQSNSVIGFCLNFAALHFVQEIDDVAFSVASAGLFSRRIQRKCLEVGQITITAKERGRTLWMRRVLVTMLLAGMYVGFFILMGWQWGGVYRCRALFVQFGDNFGPELAYYSGRFEPQGSTWKGRPAFLHESGELELVYNDKQRAYLFRWTSPADVECLESEYLIKSSETTTYDVTQVAGDIWYANMQGGDKPLESFSMDCADCTPSRCWAEHGTCVDNVCVCDDEHVGLFCEVFRESCDTFSLDYRTSGDLQNFQDGYFFLDSKFGVVKEGGSYSTPLGSGTWTETISVFDRSIYYHLNMHAVIVFSGRRWIMFGSPGNNHEDICPCDFDDYLQRSNINDQDALDALRIIGSYKDFVPLYFSAPMDYNTPSDSDVFTGLDWYTAQEDNPKDQCDTPDVILGYTSSILGYIPDGSYSVSAQHMCSQCVDDGDCYNNGRCNKDSGVCECQYLYEGSMCEQTRSCTEVGCANGGTCDPVKGICTDCGNKASGNLCQFPLPRNLDPFFCSTPNPAWVDPRGAAFPSNGKCANSQKCNGLQQMCECQPPFTGPGCIQANQASCYVDTPSWSDPCENGGYCDRERYPSYPICVCPPGYFGDFCRLQS